MTQGERILALLRERGEAGATNFELNKISFRYSARIHVLRHREGHDIRAENVGGTKWVFTLVESKEETPKAVSWLNEDD